MTNYLFSPALERALEEAARWQNANESESLTLPAVLLALAAENEYRAAQILLRHGITLERVQSHWPQLKPSRASDIAIQLALAPDFEHAVRAAQSRLEQLPQPLALATEHLLLGILDVPGAAARWLGEHGLNADEIQSEIYALYGDVPGPIEIDWEPPVRGQSQPAEEEAVARNVPPPTSGVQISDTAKDVSMSVLRVLDATANRAREAVRVVEDYVRFVLDDRHLTQQCKRLRHELTSLLAALPLTALLVSRETQSDVGTDISLPSERRRDQLADVVTANLKRLQESLRTLEEFGKTSSAELGQGFEQLRYRSYTLERAIAITHSSLSRLEHARLYVLIDGGDTLNQFESLARSLVAAGVDVLQLRDKRLDDRTLLDRARRLRAITHSSPTLLVVNDRPDLAALCQADGVHVGQEELSVKDARTIVGLDRLVGVSTHSIEQARQAVLDGANYIGVGPTFPSGTKQFDRFTGMELLREVSREIRLPAFAIGGIDLDRLAQVLAAGVQRVAVSGAIVKASDPAAAAKTFLDRLKRT
jgi:thiamine-phosphate pyrophosphorylase